MVHWIHLINQYSTPLQLFLFVGIYLYAGILRTLRALLLIIKSGGMLL